MVAQHGVAVVNQKHLRQRRRLPGILAGAKEEVEEETLEDGANRQGEAGGNSTLKRPKEAGMPPVLLPRIRRLVHGAEL